VTIHGGSPQNQESIARSCRVSKLCFEGGVNKREVKCRRPISPLSPLCLSLSLRVFLCSYPLTCSNGSVNVKRLPAPGRLSTQILPPCVSTTRRQKARPRPLPRRVGLPSCIW